MGLFWLFTDETNIEPSQGRFFIYGGLILTPEQMLESHNAIAEIRSKYGFKAGDAFKFQTNSRPSHMSIPDWTSAKREAIAAAERIGAILIIYVVLHDIAKNKSKQTNLEWALNSVLAHFDMRFLAEKLSYGMVCLDRIPESFGYAYLRGKFQEGITLPDGRECKLHRIIHYSMSCDGASHISSLVDITLGGMRYAINAVTGSGKEELARQILQPLARMMWYKQEPSGTHQVGGYGFLRYPKEVMVSAYDEEYKKLAETLSQWGSSGEE
jgi:hypothetical protein